MGCTQPEANDPGLMTASAGSLRNWHRAAVAWTRIGLVSRARAIAAGSGVDLCTGRAGVGDDPGAFGDDGGAGAPARTREDGSADYLAESDQHMSAAD